MGKRVGKVVEGWGEDGVGGCDGSGRGWVTDAGYRGGWYWGKCVRWIVDKLDRRQQTVWGEEGRGKKAGGVGKKAKKKKSKKKMGKEYKRRWEIN